MNSFEIKTKIYFGENSLNMLSEIKNKKVLIITDPFMVKSGAINFITERLKDAQYEIFSDIVPDPPIETVVQGIEYMGKINPDVLIALGGGSAIDAAKAIMDFSKKIVSSKDMEFIAIPTTSGTGSEVTSFSVITDKSKGTKYPLVSQDLLPDIAILDPNMVKSVPNFITADTGMDVLTHALEAYVSTNASDFSDALAEKAASLVFKYLIRAYENGEDTEAREKMHNASCLAGLAFNAAGLGLNHGIAHAIGGKLHIPHGRTNSILLPHIIEYNAEINGFGSNEYSRAALKYAKLSKILGFPSSTTRSAVRSLINEIKKMQKHMKMPITLRECNIELSKIEEFKEGIGEAALKDGCTEANPKAPSKKDIIQIIDKIKI
ncbi:iron-containing alcohol dehydrogenase [Clostridium sp. MSJ-11]|uniref:Iron-containing alcohol dehydrogenase n=1 Tax=Clostridium mobile TaxID=2841512 RepID=A0ABS6EFD3_9CLOT|nr:iron-containing alcohol dehydrogenase [Clostridium mobile]